MELLLKSSGFQIIFDSDLAQISEKAMAPHSGTLAWKIPWMEEPGGLQSMVSLRVGHDWATSLSFFTLMHWRRKLQPTPVFLPWESQGRGSLVGCLYGVAQSWTRLKWLSSSTNTCVYGYISMERARETERERDNCFTLHIIYDILSLSICILYK